MIERGVRDELELNYQEHVYGCVRNLFMFKGNAKIASTEYN